MCNLIVEAPDTDFVCILPHAHAGDHEFVDAMRFQYDEAGNVIGIGPKL